MGYLYTGDVHIKYADRDPEHHHHHHHPQRSMTSAGRQEMLLRIQKNLEGLVHDGQLSVPEQAGDAHRIF